MNYIFLHVLEMITGKNFEFYQITKYLANSSQYRASTSSNFSSKHQVRIERLDALGFTILFSIFTHNLN